MRAVVDELTTTAASPLKATALLAGVGSKPVPVIVTEAPAAPEFGETAVIATPPVPAPLTVKGVADVAVPSPVVTVMSPVVAPGGTLTTSEVPVAETM